MYSCLIIDDDDDSIEVLVDCLNLIPEITILGIYKDPVKAASEIMAKGQTIDFVFMDIDMPKISGIDLSKVIKQKINKLIFTTAHTRYAFEAFEVEADGYLLKPITYLKLVNLINKNVRESKPESLNVDDKDVSFYVKSTEERNKWIQIKYEFITHIESLKNYVKIFTTKENIITYLTLKEVTEALSGRDEFIQVHRSFIVSKYAIEKVEANIIRLTNNTNVPIGQSYKDSFFSYLNSNSLKTGR